MKLELDVELDGLVSAVLEEIGETPTVDEVQALIDDAVGELDIEEMFGNLSTSTLVEALDGYLVDSDDMLSEDYVREMADEIARDVVREEGVGFDEDTVTEHARRLLQSIPSSESSLCEIGQAFRDGVVKILQMPSAVEALKEALELNVRPVPTPEDDTDEPSLTLRGVLVEAESRIAHLSPTFDQAQELAASTSRHGQHVKLEIPLSMARRVLIGELNCSAREIDLLKYRLVPNAVYRAVEYDQGTIARCSEAVRSFVREHDRQPVTAEAWLVVFDDRSVWGPFASRAEAQRAQDTRCQGMNTLVRKATLPVNWA